MPLGKEKLGYGPRQVEKGITAHVLSSGSEIINQAT